MEKTIDTLLTILDERYKLTIDLVDKNTFYKFKLSYYIVNTGHELIEYNASKQDLIRLSDVPVWLKERIIDAKFL